MQQNISVLAKLTKFFAKSEQKQEPLSVSVGVVSKLALKPPPA